MTQQKGGYVDGFVLVVPKKNLKAYEKMAKAGAKLWRKHGALDYRECVGEDMKVSFGLPFPKLVKLKPGEVPLFSFIAYKSRAHRDQVNKRVMSDMSMSEFKDKPMPFDMKRMAYGGFKVLV